MMDRLHGFLQQQTEWPGVQPFSVPSGESPFGALSLQNTSMSPQQLLSQSNMMSPGLQNLSPLQQALLLGVPQPLPPDTQTAMQYGTPDEQLIGLQLGSCFTHSDQQLGV